MEKKAKNDAPEIKPSLEMVENLIKLLENSDHREERERGACVYNTPNGPKCAQLTREECSVLKGSYIGGPCN